MSESRLFKPINIGKITLSHRVGMSPLTRLRASDEHVPTDLMVEYYKQRSSVKGTLLVSEGTYISPADGGLPNVPGIYNQDQIKAWKKVTDAVHANGSYIYAQLWALGRAANPDVAKAEGFTVVSSDAKPLDSNAPVPERLSLDGIKEKIQNYANAAKNAIAAGFDGVEIHGANGYLIDQFTQDRANQRDDNYGGSIENRSRFAVEVTNAVVDAVGADKTGIRLSPWSTFQGMKMDEPIPQFSDLIKKIAPLKLAYLHLVESRISGNADAEDASDLEFVYNLWDQPLLVAGGYKSESAHRLVDEEHPDKDIIVAFGRYFISTPDLPFRIQNGLEWTEYNRDTFYVPKSPTGYTDYTFSKEFLEQKA